MLDITCESSAENYVEYALKMLSASRDWRFKG